MKNMKKIFVDSEWLWNFMDREGIDAYNSLVKSNNIVTNGVICMLNIKLPINLKKTK